MVITIQGKNIFIIGYGPISNKIVKSDSKNTDLLSKEVKPHQ